MKKLKKMFALSLILCMALTGVMPVYAVGVQNDTLGANAHESVVYYEYDSYMKELFQLEVYDYTLVDSSCTSLTLEAGQWYVIDGTVTLQSRVENRSLVGNPAKIILKNGCTLYAPYGIENGSRNSLHIYGQDKNGGTGQLIIHSETVSVPEGCAGIGGGSSPGENAQGCGYVEINGGILDIYGGKNAAGIGGGDNAADVSVTINAGDVTAHGGEKGAGIGTGYGSTADIQGKGKIIINGGTVEATGGKWGAGIGCGYYGYPNLVEINGGNVTANGGSDGGAGIGGGHNTSGVDTTITGGTVCAIGKNTASGIGLGLNGVVHRSLTITGEQVVIYSGTNSTNATATAADSYVRLREPYVRMSVTKYPVYTVTWKLDDGNTIDITDVTEGKMPVHSDPVKDGYIFTGWTPALAPVTGDVTYTACFYELAHEHSYSEAWSKNETHHWHKAACEHTDLVSGFGEHSFGTDGKCTVCEYEKETSELEEALAELAEAQAMLIETQKALEEKTSSLTEAEEKLSKANAALTETQKALDEKTASLKTTEGNLAEAAAALAEANDQIQSLTSELSNTGSELTKINAALEEAKSSLETAKSEKAALEKQLADKEAELKNLKESADASEKEIAALESNVTALEKEISEANSEIAQKNEQIESLNGELEKAKAEIEELKNRSGEQEDEVCSKCGKTHSDNFWGKTICFFNRIGNFFRDLFKKIFG